MKKGYDLIFSIGSSCVTSYKLRKNKLQFKSYPFDWVSGMNLALLIELLKNNFNSFLIKEELKLIKNQDNNSCYIYSNKKIEFYHDFKKGLDFEESFKLVKEKYDRRIKRLLSQIEKSKTILLVYSSDSNNLSTKEDLDELNKIYPGKTFDLLNINLNKNITDLEISEKENITNVKIPYDGELKGNQPPWKKLFKNYKLNNIPKKYLIIYYNKNFIYPSIIRIICSFIPIKKHRKAVRSKLKTFLGCRLEVDTGATETKHN